MLPSRINSMAMSPLLLVASDFDGTISPLAPSPDEARADPRCMAALTRLARLPCTAVAIISGRPLKWLKQRTETISGIQLFGSHGAEDGSASESSSKAEAEVRVMQIASSLEPIAARWPGCLVERKPFGVALHYRRADPAYTEAIIDATLAVARNDSSIAVRMGSMVVELCVSSKNKGDALQRAIHLAGARNTVFLGDDLTDEDAFAVLGDSDLAIRVGEGQTAAPFRVDGIESVADALAALADQRERWVPERVLVPIQHHSILSDQRTLALVTPSARITWLCVPRIDSSSLFAELVGGPQAGYFAIEPENGATPTGQTYNADSMLLSTQWRDFVVTDYLDCSGGRAFQRAGRSDLVRVIDGRGRVRVLFAPRPDFGRAPATLTSRPEGIEIDAGGDPCVLHAPGLSWKLIADGVHVTAEAIADLSMLGGSLTLELRYGTANLRPSVVPEPQRRAQTQRLWSGWTGALRLPAQHRDVLARSALTIKALCNGPGGAIAAAGTTSLPEQLGGVRNWDYRFCWPRDAAMAATALLRLGNTGHAMKLTEWLVGIVDRLDSPERLRPIYAVQGEELGSEAEIGGLSGYAGSRPVRIGNAAAQQVQLDVFGPVTHMVASMTERGVPVSPDAWRLVRAMVRAVEARWEEPDHGIWEVRGPRRHHVHSKVMCWHTVDRALVVHDAMLGKDNFEWRALRDRIAAEVLDRGWNRQVAAFTGAYETSALDAAVLAVGLCGLVPVADPRWAATVEAIERSLRDGATVYRYRGDDGLPGTEGGFVICACWLVEAMVTLGRLDDARKLFDDILLQAGPTGLFAEQWDQAQHVALGNFPQAYSHLGVINAALALAGSSRTGSA
ncbi:MAG: trehalose-phosphatase [Phycisphaerales bacterium]|nr:trehalose-phosphatase [Phycisphaerales bacterium]